MVWATPGPPLTLSLPTSFSLPRKHQFFARNCVLAVLAHDFSISLLSPSVLLKFGAFVLRYVTPPLVQSSWKVPGDPPGGHTTWWRGLPWVAPCHGVGHPWPSTHSLTSHFFLSPEKTSVLCSKLRSCCSCPRFFDLLAQPICAAEIWSICSPVCDSSACPSRFVFSGLYLEYFAATGDMF